MRLLDSSFTKGRLPDHQEHRWPDEHLKQQIASQMYNNSQHAPIVGEKPVQMPAD